MIAITGAVCAGKTTVREALAEQLGWQHFGIDDCDGWDSMVDRVSTFEHGRYIIESVLVPKRLMVAYRRWQPFLIHCTYSERVRRRRLAERGIASTFVDRRPGFRIDTTHGIPAARIDEVARHYGGST